MVAWSAGWLIGIAGLLMAYLGVALITNTAFARPLLPVPGPVGFARAG